MHIPEAVDVIHEKLVQHRLSGRKLLWSTILKVQATDARSTLAESGSDSGASPAEDLLGLTGGTIAVLEGRLRLKLSAPKAGEKFGG